MQRSFSRLISRFVQLTALAAGLAAATTSEANAAEPAKPSVVIQMMSATCPVLVGQLTGRPEMATILKARPVDVASVCTCASLAMNADAKLKARFVGDSPAALSDERVKAYLMVRLFSSVFSCLTPELDASLKATPLD
ncbi:MAG TPA: hypothetical protein VMH83_15320 [Candidatus Acidoferrum sp.]|nr:hypothetical protein [Candidatus Acidoferrum sp.]